MRAPGPTDAGERLHEAAERARAELRAACRAGDVKSCALLRELGELAAPRPWCDVDDRGNEED